MTDDLKTIEIQLQALEQRSADIAARLDAAAEALECHGYPSEKHLIDDLAQLRSDQTQLARMLPQLPHEPLPSLSEIGRELQMQPATLSIFDATMTESIHEEDELEIEADQSIEELAAISLSETFSRTEHLYSLLCESLAHDRSSAAYLLGQCLSANHHAFDVLRLRSWILSEALVYYTGAIAAELRRSFDTLIDELSSDKQHTLPALLMTAAISLRPALIAPETGAVTLLQRVSRLLPMHLSNYCRKILSMGGKRITPNQFQSQSDSAHGKQVAALRDDVRGWKQKTSDIVRYELAEPLFLRAHWSIRAPSTYLNETGLHHWKAWLECEKLAGALIAPILGEESSNTRTRDALHRLTQKVEDPDVLLKPEMETHLVELKTLAERWLILQSGQVAAAEFPDEADQVLSELADQKRVHEELAELTDADNPSELHIAIQCLKRSLADVQRMATSGYDSTREEALPENLLHRELLYMDNVQLVGDGSPLISAEFEETLLKYLSEAQPTFKAAFERHLASGNFDRAELLMAGEVKNSAEVDQLAQKIVDSREAFRERLWAQFREATSILDRDSNSQSSSHVEAWKEVRQIRLALEGEEADLGVLKSRLSRLRNELTQQRDQDSNQGWIMEF